MREIVYAAAHAGIDPGRVPIGGGAAVCAELVRHWAARGGFRVTLLGLGDGPPAEGVEYHRVPVTLPAGRRPDDLVRLRELDYARLCRDFSAGVSDYLRRRTERDGVCVLVNDLSEGPDFAALRRDGWPVVTLWHVDVVDYFSRFYLGGLSPEALTRLRRAWPVPLPGVLRLVFDQQAACVAASSRHIVPSRRMKEVIDRCYPGAGERVEVVPWGAPDNAVPADAVATEAAALRTALGLAGDEVVLLCLSRLSPEKGIDRVLRALAGGPLPCRARLLIAGEAAYMQGARYRRRLARLAGRSPVRVDFLGQVGGARKAAVFELADLYLFPSRHESYGLTLAEALAAGLPAICTDHAGARDVLPCEAGLVVPNGPEAVTVRALHRALAELLGDPARRRRMAAAARAAGSRQSFAAAADRVADICRAAVALNRDWPIRGA